MAKKYIIYASGKDLATVPVTQNEVGKYYRNSAGTYYKPILANFDNVSLPAGYKTYIGGSHAKYISNANRNPIDFSLVAGSVLSMNVDVNVLAINPSDGSWCKITPVGSNYVIALVHTYQWAKGLVKVGSPICKIAPQSVTGFAPHLHIDEWSNRGLKIRELILDGDFKMNIFKIGDRVEFTGIQNIRKGAGDKFDQQRSTVVGEVATIKDGPRTSQNKQFGKGENDNYIWWDMQFDNGGTGWVADVNKFKIYVPTSPPVPEPPAPEPSNPCQKYIDEVETLKREIEGLKSALTNAEKEITKRDDLLKMANDRVEHLESVVDDYKESEKKILGELETLREEKGRIEQDKLKIQQELDALKQGKDNWIDRLVSRLADILHKLFEKK